MKTFKQYHLNEAAISKVLFANPYIRQYEGTKNRISAQEKEDLLGKAYDSLLPTLERTRDKLAHMLTTVLGKKPRSGSRPTLKMSIKKLSSVISKVAKRNKIAYEVGDLVRCAVLFDSPDQVKDFVKEFNRKFGEMVTKHEEKVKGEDKTYGYYGTHHFDVEIDGLVIEIQVGTKKLWNFKREAHKIYTANREKGGPDKFAKWNSKRIFTLGNRPKYTKEDADGRYEFDVEDILEFEDFEENEDLTSLLD